MIFRSWIFGRQISDPFGSVRGGRIELSSYNADSLRDHRPDDDVLIFRGPPNDGVGALLRGHVALCIRENTQIRSITLILQGIKRLQ